MFHVQEDRSGDFLGHELISALESGRAEFEGLRIRKDGSRFVAGVVITPIHDAAGALSGYVKLVRDLATEQKRAYNMFHGLMEGAPDAIVIIGQDGRITMVNAQTDRMFGYSREELLGQEVEILVPQRYRTNHVRFRTDFFTAPTTRRMGSGIELTGMHRDGREVPIEVTLSPIRIEDTVYVSAAIRDVTERREYEQRLRRQHEEIMELSTPVIQVWEKVLCLPLIGTLDSMRAASGTDLSWRAGRPCLLEYRSHPGRSGRVGVDDDGPGRRSDV